MDKKKGGRKERRPERRREGEKVGNNEEEAGRRIGTSEGWRGREGAGGVSLACTHQKQRAE